MVATVVEDEEDRVDGNFKEKMCASVTMLQWLALDDPTTVTNKPSTITEAQLQ